MDGHTDEMIDIQNTHETDQETGGKSIKFETLGTKRMHKRLTETFGLGVTGDTSGTRVDTSGTRVGKSPNDHFL
jgi:hypothetical protein